MWISLGPIYKMKLESVITSQHESTVGFLLCKIYGHERFNRRIQLFDTTTPVGQGTRSGQTASCSLCILNVFESLVFMVVSQDTQPSSIQQRYKFTINSIYSIVNMGSIYFIPFWCPKHNSFMMPHAILFKWKRKIYFVNKVHKTAKTYIHTSIGMCKIFLEIK